MPLTFRLKTPLTIPVDASALRIETLCQSSLSAIGDLPVWHGNQQVPCRSVFDISGSADDRHLCFEGDCSKVKSIGAQLHEGRIDVHGSAGMHLGAGMSGGTIQVNGDAGDWAGAEMRKGRIVISGNAGNNAGGAYRGSKKGMLGGEILIHGNAGDCVGERMRRGLIYIAGNSGEATGAGMIAGTILVSGQAGPHIGLGMKRGSIVLLNPADSHPVSTTFRYATTMKPLFLQLYFRHLRAQGMTLDPEICSADYRMYRGDNLELGLGEILCRAA